MIFLCCSSHRVYDDIWNLNTSQLFPLYSRLSLLSALFMWAFKNLNSTHIEQTCVQRIKYFISHKFPSATYYYYEWFTGNFWYNPKPRTGDIGPANLTETLFVCVWENENGVKKIKPIKNVCVFRCRAL